MRGRERASAWITAMMCSPVTAAVLAALRRKGKGSDVSEEQMTDVVRAHNGEVTCCQCSWLPDSAAGLGATGLMH